VIGIKKKGKKKKKEGKKGKRVLYWQKAVRQDATSFEERHTSVWRVFFSFFFLPFLFFFSRNEVVACSRFCGELLGSPHTGSAC
jgi:hypothetical protein